MQMRDLFLECVICDLYYISMPSITSAKRLRQTTIPRPCPNCLQIYSKYVHNISVCVQVSVRGRVRARD